MKDKIFIVFFKDILTAFTQDGKSRLLIHYHFILLMAEVVIIPRETSSHFF